SAKIRLRGRLTQLISALQSAQFDTGQKVSTQSSLGLTAVQREEPPPPPPPPPPAPEPVLQGPPVALIAKALRKLLAAIEGSGFKAVAVGDVAHVAWGSKY